MIKNYYYESKAKKQSLRDKILSYNGKRVCVCWKKAPLQKGNFQAWGVLHSSENPYFKAYLKSDKGKTYIINLGEIEFVVLCVAQKME